MASKLSPPSPNLITKPGTTPAIYTGNRTPPYEPARRQRSCHVPRTGVCPPHLNRCDLRSSLSAVWVDWLLPDQQVTPEKEPPHLHVEEHCGGLAGDLPGGQRRIHDDGHGRVGGVLREPTVASQQPFRQEHRAKQAMSGRRGDLGRQLMAQVPGAGQS